MPIISGSSAALSTLPGYEIGYDQITSSVVVTSTTQATGTTIITCAAHTFDGAPVIAEFFAPVVTSDITAAGDIVLVSLFEGATQIAGLWQVKTVVVSAPANVPASARIRFTPTAGSHTYTVTAFSTANNGAVISAGTGGTAAYAPAYIRFTKA